MSRKFRTHNIESLQVGGEHYFYFPEIRIPKAVDEIPSSDMTGARATPFQSRYIKRRTLYKICL